MNISVKRTSTGMLLVTECLGSTSEILGFILSTTETEKQETNRGQCDRLRLALREFDSFYFPQ